MKMKASKLFSLLILSLLLLAPSVVLAKPGKGGGSGTASQELIASTNGGAATWDQTTIEVLIVPNVYDPEASEVKDVKKGIDEWKAAITWFSNQDWDGDRNADYPWLDQLDFLVYVHGVNGTGTADISVTLYYKITPGYILGYAALSYKQVNEEYAINSVEIFLGVKGLSGVGIQNLMAHEFGHALGLGHSTKRGDLMYPSFDVSEEKKKVVAPSTLNIYALTINHGWLESGTFTQYYGSLTIILPSDIPYQKAPIVEEDGGKGPPPGKGKNK